MHTSETTASNTPADWTKLSDDVFADAICSFLDKEDLARLIMTKRLQRQALSALHQQWQDKGVDPEYSRRAIELILQATPAISAHNLAILHNNSGPAAERIASKFCLTERIVVHFSMLPQSHRMRSIFQGPSTQTYLQHKIRKELRLPQPSAEFILESISFPDRCECSERFCNCIEISLRKVAKTSLRA